MTKMKNLFKAYKEWRDRKFIERIDRVYFKKDKDKNLFIKGNLIVEGKVLYYGNAPEANEVEGFKTRRSVSKKKSK
jgi:hypothetical protein